MDKEKKDEIINIVKRFVSDTRKVILFSLAIAFIMCLISFGLSRVEQSYAFVSCAVLWGLSLIALAILENKKDT